MKHPIEKKFNDMGADIEVTEMPKPFKSMWARARRSKQSPISIDIQDGAFDIKINPTAEIQVIHTDPKDRHLVLQAKDEDGIKSQFLCGHDERNWFVAAVPEDSSVHNVQSAKDALRPKHLTEELVRKGVKDKNSRKNDAYRRQGEWFFIPHPEKKVDPKVILKNEPIQRGRGRPHMVAELFRTGGKSVWIARGKSHSYEQYIAIPAEQRKNMFFRQMQENPQVFVRGTIKHPDHNTIELDCWHEVVQNTETEAIAMRHVQFLD